LSFVYTLAYCYRFCSHTHAADEATAAIPHPRLLCIYVWHFTTRHISDVALSGKISNAKVIGFCLSESIKSPPYVIIDSLAQCFPTGGPQTDF